MGYVVDFADQAQADLKDLYDYVREKAGDRQARALVANIYDYCLSFDTFPHRGTKRDDLTPGLRTVGWHRRATIAFTVEPSRVLILRLLFRGRDPGKSFSR